MLKRFLGPAGDLKLIECLKQQILMQGNENLAQCIKEKISLKEFKKGEIIIRQNETDSILYFLISGSASININGRIIAERKAPTHIGEMAIINPTTKRTATVIALEDCIAALLNGHDFESISCDYPFVVKQIALELSRRLEQRTRLIRPVNPKPVIFIGSSKESLSFAKLFKNSLKDDLITINLWSDSGIINISKFAIEDLENQVKA